MARIRTIKPDFFMSDDVGSLTVNSRLLYVALWCHCDRNGIIKFQKTGLAAQCMPFEFNMFDDCIAELIESGLVLPYQVENNKYLYIPTFTEHQRPHHTEKESGNPEFNGLITVDELLDNRKERERILGKDTRKGRERKGKDIMSSKLDDDAKAVIDYLNSLSGKSFQHVDTNTKLVKARLAQVNLETAKLIIDMKCDEWLDTKMDKYLRPATLFNDQKFNQYLGELPKWIEERAEQAEWINDGGF